MEAKTHGRAGPWAPVRVQVLEVPVAEDSGFGVETEAGRGRPADGDAPLGQYVPYDWVHVEATPDHEMATHMRGHRWDSRNGKLQVLLEDKDTIDGAGEGRPAAHGRSPTRTGARQDMQTAESLQFPSAGTVRHH